MAKEDKVASDQTAREGLGDVMLVPVTDDEQAGADVLTEAEARAFMERPIGAQTVKEATSG